MVAEKMGMPFSATYVVSKYFTEVQVAKLPTVESVIELVNTHFVKE